MSEYKFQPIKKHCTLFYIPPLTRLLKNTAFENLKQYEYSIKKEWANGVSKMTIQHHKQGCDYQKISEQLHISISATGVVVCKCTDLQRIGQPSNMDATSRRWIARTVQKNHFATCSNIQHGLKQKKQWARTGLVGASTMLVYVWDLQGKLHQWNTLIIAPLKFAKLHENKSSTVFCNKFLWSDETKIELCEKNAPTHIL